jgi:hypothetical protein
LVSVDGVAGDGGVSADGWGGGKGWFMRGSP